MDLKWLEDFVSLAETRSFSRSAEERHVTQPAFSRRIQALEMWLGAPLIDRTTYPTTLTESGRRFRETAEEIIQLLGTARADLTAESRTRRRSVSMAALHTLALTFFPRWFGRIEEATGSIGSRLLADDFHNCLQAIAENGYDFLLTYHHPCAPVTLDPSKFPYLVVGTDALVAVRSPRLPEESSLFLDYASNSFLGRVSTYAQAMSGLESAIVHTSENAMAEALKFMALEGHGAAWLPRSLVKVELERGELVTFGSETALEIRLYRALERRRGAVDAVWNAASALAAKPMFEAHNPG